MEDKEFLEINPELENDSLNTESYTDSKLLRVDSPSSNSEVLPKEKEKNPHYKEKFWILITLNAVLAVYIIYLVIKIFIDAFNTLS